MLTSEQKNELIKALCNYLDTRDKRFMFLKILFPILAYKINLEGSIKNTSWEIYNEFEKQEMLESLIMGLNNVFNLKL